MQMINDEQSDEYLYYCINDKGSSSEVSMLLMNQFKRWISILFDHVAEGKRIIVVYR